MPPTAAPLAEARAGAGPAESGFVVWESNRTGAYRIWRQELAPGAAPRQISPDEQGRDHCCAKLSPDGRRLVYLSLPGGARGYRNEVGALRLADADGGRDRPLVSEARHSGENRAAVWWGTDEILHLDGQGRSVLRKLSTGESRLLASPAKNGEGWLIEPGGRFATGNTPTFCEVRDGKVVERPSMGGCQPAFTADGSRAVWSAGAGGPIDAIDLATRRTWSLISKNDPRLPEGRRYVYFPMLSADSTLLALAGSNGEHDHFRADYDVLVVEVDPATLRPRADAIVVAPHPAVDRFPDPFRGAAPPVPVTGATPPAGTAASPGSAADRARADRLNFAWDRGDAAAQPAAAAPSMLRPHDLAWLDRAGAMALGGGSFSADEEVGAALAAALRDSNQLSLALRLAPASLRQDAAILALSAGGARRGVLLRQRGDRLELVLRTSDTAREGRAVEIATLRSSDPVHLVVTFSPGRLSTYLDGVPAGPTQPFPGDFFHWKAMPLVFGTAPGETGHWRGALGHLAVWSRELDAAESATEARRSSAAATPAAPRSRVEARVVRTSPAPDLASISPYREALAVDEIEVVRQLGGEKVPTRIRRVRWAILDGRTLPAPAPGAVQRLALEPFSAQPQLQSLYLADELGEGDAPLWFDLAATAEP